MDELASYEGKRIEVELEGELIRGRVVRGPGRKPLFLEERGEVGELGTGTHARLGLLRVWRPRELEGGRFVRELVEGPATGTPRRRRRKPEWAENIAVAEGDPARPPVGWSQGALAWAEAVHAARRQVERGRKAMMKALKEAAG